MIELAGLAIFCIVLVAMGVVADRIVEPWLDRRDARRRNSGR
jgi:hypothetical protein